MKEQFDRDIKNLLKKNEGSIAKIEEQHGAEKQEKSVDGDELKQLLDNQKQRKLDIKNKFDRDTKNLRKKSEQYKAYLRKLNEKQDIEVAALKNEIKRLEDLDQLKKAESKCAQVKDENATLTQMIAQLEAESAFKNKNDNTTAEAE
nr:unnamed protein product [Callosobruchus chinensis]